MNAASASARARRAAARFLPLRSARPGEKHGPSAVEAEAQACVGSGCLEELISCGIHVADLPQRRLAPLRRHGAPRMLLISREPAQPLKYRLSASRVVPHDERFDQLSGNRKRTRIFDAFIDGVIPD